MEPDKPTIGHVLHRMDRAGAEVLAEALARRLADRYRFVFLCLDGLGQIGEQLLKDGLTVVNLGRRPGLDLSVARRLSGAVSDHQIELLHAHQYTPFCYAALSRRFASRPPILFTEHGRHYPDQRKLKRVLANRWLLKRCDHVTAVGRFVKQALVDNEGIEASRVEVIHNGIDPESFPPVNTQARAQARRELGVGDDCPLVMQVARLHSVKDHATAVRAFAQVIKRLPDARLCLVGDGALREELEALVRELEVQDRVLFTGVRADVKRLLPAADLFMLSSLSEGISVTLLEAMSVGLAIVATRVGGNPEVVEHGVTGLLSDRRDDNALAQNILALLSDPEKRKACAQAGRRRLLERFTQQQMHRGYADCYARMLKRG